MTVSNDAIPRPKLLWLISILVLLSTNANWLTASSNVIPVNVGCVIAPNAIWNPPVNAVAMTIPFLVFALITSISITILCGGASRYAVTPLSVLGIVSLSLLAQPNHTLFGVCAFAIVASSRWTTTQQRPFLSIVLSATGLLGGILVSLEFGLLVVLFYAVCFSEQHYGKYGKPAAAIVGVGLVAAAMSLPGFLNAMLRPVNWLSVVHRSDLLPSMKSVFSQPEEIVPGVLLALLFAVIVWKRSKNSNPFAFAILVGLMAIGLGCFRFAWFVAAVVIAFPTMLQDSASLRFSRLSLLAGFAFAIFQLGQIATDVQEEVLRTDDSTGLLDVANWNTAGDVLLFNLDDSSDWATAERAKDFRLVINDRWDAYADTYDKYAIALRDIREMRSQSYVMDDGGWAGYVEASNNWKFSLLVLDSNDLQGIRGLSISPDFNFMGADRRNVVFGAKAAKNRVRMSLATRSILKLEWPSQISMDDISRTMVAKSEADRRRAAEVLLAMRLPFAALRYLKNDDSNFASDLQAECYVELAHRAERHSNSFSAMHHSRAIAWANDRLMNSTTLSDSQRGRLSYFLDNIQRKLDGPQQCSTGVSIARSDLSLLANHNRAEIKQRLTSVSSAEQRLLSLWEQIKDTSPEDLLGKLVDVEDAEPGLQSEVLFFAGCLAIETGDTQLALRLLGQSEELHPDSQFRAIRRMHLGRLATP